MKKMTVNLGGKAVEAEVMNFTTMAEPWSVYRLEDGITFKMKLVVSNVLKLPTTDPLTGLPQLIVSSSNVITVEPPDTPPSKREVH